MHASKFEHMIGSTSLPPKIEGQVRRYIKIEIPFLSWVPPTPAQDALVKVLWWGEEGGGTVFRPGRSRKQRKDASEMTCALYQVRSGPKQFLEYLKDMKVLCLQVIQATNNNAIGQAFIQRLHQLSPGKPIKGLYPVITSSNTKVADIQVNISMEPLNIMPDINHSIPTPDADHILPAYHTKMDSLTLLPPQPPTTTATTSVTMAATAATAAASNDAKNQIGTDFINLNMNPLKENIEPFVTFAPSSAQHPSNLGDLDAMLVFGEHLRDAMLKASISNSRQLFQTQANMQKNNIADELLSGDDINIDVQPVELILDSIKQFPSAPNIFNSDARHGKPGSMFGGAMLESNHNADVALLASNSEDLLFDDELLQELVYDNIDGLPSRENVSKVRERIPNDNNSNAGEGEDEEEGEGRRERKERKRSRSLVVEGHSVKLHSNRAKSSTSAVAYNHKPPNSHAGVSKSKRCSFGGVTRHRTNILPASYPEVTVTIRDFLFTDQSFFKQMTSKIPTPSSSSTADVSFKSRSFYITCDVVHRRATSTSKTSASSSQQASTHSTPDDDVLSSYKTKPFTRGSANSTVVTFNEEFSVPILIGLKRTRHDGVVVDDDDGDADGDDDIDEEMKNVCLIFKVFQHIPFSSIKPKQIGVCTFPLKWFQQGDLSITEALIVKHQHTNLPPSPPRHRHHQHPASKHKFASAAEAGQSIGLLKVHIELHRKAAGNAGESSNDGDVDGVNEPVMNADVDAAGRKTYVVDCDEDEDEEEEDGRGSDGGSHSDKFVKDDAYKVSSKTSDQKQGTKQDTSAHIGLFISRAEMIPRNKKEELNEHLHNYYIVVRSFWLKEPTKTPVVWSSTLPLFNFRQVAPVHLKDALQKMRKMNMVVVEVWNKKPSSDLLVGLCKLSLDQFVLTFGDSSMWKSLLHNKYPVVAVNDAVEIRCPIEGQVTGHLYVKLVMGSLDQVTEFDLNPFAQDEDEDSIFSLGGNGNNDNDDETSELANDYTSDVRKVSKWRKVVGKKSIGEATTLRRSSILSGRDVMLNEHTFMVYIDSIIDFKCTEGQQWSDAECYVQYTFLYQPSPSMQSFNRQHLGRIAVKSTRTSPVKYSTNMSFGESFQHVILHRIVYHIQQIISKVFSGVGNENDMTFEVWCRRYQPVVCDVLVAKAYLPLTSVYQMLIHRPSSDSSFIDLSLPLFSSSKEGGHLATSRDQGGSGVCGYLRLRLDYETRTRKLTAFSSQTMLHGLSGSNVIVSLTLSRVCGLQKAALQLLGHHLPLSNYLQTGLNVYLTASLSFLPIGNEKSTQTVTKTFHPDLFSSFEFACPLFWKNPSSRDNKPMTLAHIFNNAYLLIKVFHQNTDATTESLLGLDVNLKGVPINPLSKASVLTNNFSVTNAASAMSAPSYVNDVLLGVVVVPLTNFPIKSSGLRGWFPIESSAAYSDLERRDYVGGSKAKVVLTGDVNNVVGGVELMLKIPSKNEREAVLSVGRSLGWSPVNQVADASFFTEERNSLKKFDVSITINNLIISPKMLPAIGAFAHSHINSDGHMNADVTGKCSNLFNIVDSTEEGNVDTACGIPLHTRCYLRYKFFDQKGSMSKLFPMFMIGEQLFVTGAYREKFRICSSAMFAWYLAEERLEVEIWMTGRDESGANNVNEANNEAGHEDGNSNAVNANEFPKPSDHLVGAGYIDFIELADLKKVKCSIRNSSMIYNASCDNIGESSFDYVITFADDIPSAKLDKILELISKGSLPPNLFSKSSLLNPNVVNSSALNPNFPDFSFLGHVAAGVDVDGSASSDADLLTGATEKMSQTVPPHEQPSKKKKFVDSKNVFKARLSIERAYHLQDVPVSGVLVVPSAYVTYNTADSEEPVSSHVISHDNNPVWYHDNDVLLSKEMLLARDKNLIIKVWHKIGGDGGIGGNRKSSTSSHLKPDKFADKVIGYVSVNLRPLTTRNFFNICGYYNIIDLAGSCKGQIKVCVTPMQWSNEAQQIPSMGTVELNLPYNQTDSGSPLETNQSQSYSLDPSFVEHNATFQTRFTESQKPQTSTNLSMVNPCSDIINNAANAPSSKPELDSLLKKNLQELEQLTIRLKQKLGMPTHNQKPSAALLTCAEACKTPVSDVQPFTSMQQSTLPQSTNVSTSNPKKQSLAAFSTLQSAKSPSQLKSRKFTQSALPVTNNAHPSVNGPSLIQSLNASAGAQETDDNRFFPYLAFSDYPAATAADNDASNRAFKSDQDLTARRAPSEYASSWMLLHSSQVQLQNKFSPQRMKRQQSQPNRHLYKLNKMSDNVEAGAQPRAHQVNHNVNMNNNYDVHGGDVDGDVDFFSDVTDAAYGDGDHDKKDSFDDGDDDDDDASEIHFVKPKILNGASALQRINDETKQIANQFHHDSDHNDDNGCHDGDEVDDTGAKRSNDGRNDDDDDDTKNKDSFLNKVNKLLEGASAVVLADDDDDLVSSLYYDSGRDDGEASELVGHGNIFNTRKDDAAFDSDEEDDVSDDFVGGDEDIVGGGENRDDNCNDDDGVDRKTHESSDATKDKNGTQSAGSNKVDDKDGFDVKVGSSMSYEIDVVPATENVDLHFDRLSNRGEGKRNDDENPVSKLCNADESTPILQQEENLHSVIVPVSVERSSSSPSLPSSNLITSSSPRQAPQQPHQTSSSSACSTVVDENLSKYWLNGHRKKISDRVVAFKTFQVPSLQDADRIARILTKQHQP